MGPARDRPPLLQADPMLVASRPIVSAIVVERR
jgi:hypothetical protein